MEREGVRGELMKDDKTAIVCECGNRTFKVFSNQSGGHWWARLYCTLCDALVRDWDNE